jgi:hypothetical protein
MNINKTLLFILFVSTLPLRSQTAAADIKKMNNFYTEAQHISMQIEYHFFENEKSSKAYQSEKGMYLKSDVGYSFTIMGVKNIQNNFYKLAVDDSKKIIMVGKADKSNVDVFSTNVIDSLLKHISNSQKKVLNNGIIQYTFNYKNIESIPYKKSILELNPDYSLSRMVLYYRKPIIYIRDGQDENTPPPYLEIKYKITSRKAVSASVFDVNKYLRIQGNKIDGVGIYANYDIVNHILQQ